MPDFRVHYTHGVNKCERDIFNVESADEANKIVTKEAKAENKFLIFKIHKTKVIRNQAHG